MGGKVWSEEEERVFWEQVVPCSPAAANPAKRLLSWDQCVELMTQKIGNNARRKYTNTMLYEHHYQNFKPGAKSPKANRFIKKHFSDMDWFKEHTTSPPPGSPEDSTSDDDFLNSLLAEASKPKAKPRRARKSVEQKTQETNVGSGAQGVAGQPGTTSFTPVNPAGSDPLANNWGAMTNSLAATTRQPLPASLASASSQAQTVGQQTVAQKFNAGRPAGTSSRRGRKPKAAAPRAPEVARAPLQPGWIITGPDGEPFAITALVPGEGVMYLPFTEALRQNPVYRPESPIVGKETPAIGKKAPVVSQQTPVAPQQASFAPRLAPFAPQLAPAQRKEAEDTIRLPSIREMFPFVFAGPEQEAVARQQADAMLLNRKRSASNDSDEKIPTPKRRLLPGHPSLRKDEPLPSSERD